MVQGMEWGRIKGRGWEVKWSGAELVEREGMRWYGLGREKGRLGKVWWSGLSWSRVG